MDDEIERLVIGVRADTAGFARDVDAMRASLDGPLAAGAERAGRAIEGALSKAIRTGHLGFDDLRKVALAVLADIAAAALRSAAAGGGEGAAAGGAAGCSVRSSGCSAAARRDARRAARFRRSGPTSSASAAPNCSCRPRAAASSRQAAAGGAREVRVSITVNGGAGADGPRALAASSRQVARAVRAALMEG